ncbi:helix-turn-helix domain-containing protein [Streptomyces sp. NPDC001339]|uniref:helix-turn-helix domain-containing protein n=1 Tax=Streptomyces sp. NPDC001339 TaxID=3364563 RepID=UPI0036CF0240
MTKLMTVDDVAKFLTVPKQWVYDNWKKQEIPFRKVGKSLRVRPHDLDRWLDKQGAQ